MKRWLAFGGCAVVLVASLLIGASSGSSTPRVERLSREVRCPTCSGQSAWESDAPAARAVQEFIRVRVDAGASDARIKAELEQRYGKSILLRPPTEGTGALVWVIPAVAFAAAAGGLGVAFARWRGKARHEPSAEDVVLVERARRVRT